MSFRQAERDQEPSPGLSPLSARHVEGDINAFHHPVQEPVREEFVDERRARELYQYFRPPSSQEADAIKLPYPDTVLQAHAQLVTWRLDVQRAMVSLIDSDTQYFVAESTKTLNLENVSVADNLMDQVWAGCVSVPKAGRLCEHTIVQRPRQKGRQWTPAYFEVCDLSLDERFNELPFVTSEPFFRYYCGVPLQTESGVNIGSLFVIDSRVLRPMGYKDIHYLETCAKNVMSHLKTIKEKMERSRAINMNMCLADFVNPKHHFRKLRQKARMQSDHASSVSSDDRPEWATPFPSKQTRSRSRGSFAQDHPGNVRETTTASPLGSDRPGQRRARSWLSVESSTDEEIESPSSREVGEEDHRKTFERAARLLRQSLSLELGGGVVFLDTVTKPSVENSAGQWRKPQTSFSEEVQNAHTTFRASSGGSSRSAKGGRPPLYRNNSKGSIESFNNAETVSIQYRAPVESVGLLAASISAISIPSEDFEGPGPDELAASLSAKELLRLVKRHINGRIYNLGRGRPSVNSSDHEMAKDDRTPPKQFELDLLRRQFPDATQVIFIPIYHANLAQWSACFAWTTSEYRVFTHDNDFLHVLSFCQCLKAETNRLATVLADQQKGDFIGSVSHELRSPLHGILASIEFLQETELTPFQKSLLDTAESCAHTLLDTISMVLDYSKINSFKRSTKAAPKSKDEESGASTPSATKASSDQLNIYQDVDLSEITEEVVEGIAFGHLLRTATNLKFNDVSFSGAGRSSELGTPTEKVIKSVTRPEIEVILDVQPPDDWHFYTQPGAFRRVVMNLFGNALKYTKHGYIRVGLKLLPMPDDSDWRLQPLDQFTREVNLVVTDTGQGISPEYLRTKIFTPFAQENSMAAGTGLGLSLVRSIVNMLGGEIDIKSTVDVGTVVTVKFPMKQVESRGMPTPGSFPHPKDNSIALLQRILNPPSIAIYAPSLSTDTVEQAHGALAIGASCSAYISGWFGFPTLQDWDATNAAKILLVDEVHLPGLMEFNPDILTAESHSLLIILCANESRAATTAKYVSNNKVNLISKPFGPHKLARTLRSAIRRLSEGVAPSTPPQTPPHAVRPPPARRQSFKAMPRIDEAARPESPRSTTGMRESVSHASSVVTQIRIQPPTDPKPDEGAAEAFPFPPAVATEEEAEDLNHLRRRSLEVRSTSAPHLEIPTQQNPSTPCSNVGAAAMESQEQRVAVSTSPRKPRLLLVDDNAVNLTLFHTFIRKQKYDPESVSLVTDGQKAVDLFKSLAGSNKPPEVVFMDIQMPIKDGFQATREIREYEAKQNSEPAFRPALIVALTGNASASDQAEAFSCGVDLYMTKPVSFKEVRRLLDNWRPGDGGAGIGPDSESPMSNVLAQGWKGLG